MGVRLSGSLVTVTDARSNQDAERKDEGRNKERVFSHGLANLLQNSFSLGASHAKDLLDFIVRIVAFLCLTCHVCRHTQSLRYPDVIVWGLRSFTLRSRMRQNYHFNFPLAAEFRHPHASTLIRSGGIFSLGSHAPVKRSHLKI